MQAPDLGTAIIIPDDARLFDRPADMTGLLFGMWWLWLIAAQVLVAFVSLFRMRHKLAALEARCTAASADVACLLGEREALVADLAATARGDTRNVADAAALADDLARVEERLAASRRYYNTTVGEYEAARGGLLSAPYARLTGLPQHVRYQLSR